MDWQQVLDLRRKVFDACGGDQQLQDTFEIFCNMYVASDWAESILKIEIRNNKVANDDYAGFGHAAHKAIESAWLRVTATTSVRKTISPDLLAKLFLAESRAEDTATWANLAGLMQAVGRNPVVQFPLYFANYMRAGLTAFTDVVERCKLETVNKEYLKSFAGDCLAGGKVYPTMVWGEDEPFMAIVNANQITKGQAGNGTKIKEWKLPTERTIQEILQAFIFAKKGESDWFGRELGDLGQNYYALKNDKQKVQEFNDFKKVHPGIEKIPSYHNRIKGDALLGQYQELAVSHRDPELRQYHFQCFWHWAFSEIYIRKEWGKMEEKTGELGNKKEVANRLFDNRKLIVECLGTAVPAAEAEKLTKPFIEQALGALPPLPDQYKLHPQFAAKGSALTIANLLYGWKFTDPTHARDLNDLRAGTFKSGTYDSFDPNKRIKVTGCTRENGILTYTYSELKKAA